MAAYETNRTEDGDLYPRVEPFDHGKLPVGSGHSLYWEQSGNPQGQPVVFLHGGPGAGTTPNHRRFFDPAHYRIILFDQRGAGRSTPYANIVDNTTDHLVSDIETLRELLGIDMWLVFGGSWGATLALVYAETHPERCLGIILRGVFLGREKELDWFLHGIRNVYPEAWQRFVEFLPGSERGDIASAYYRRLIDNDPKRFTARLPSLGITMRHNARPFGTSRLAPPLGAVPHPSPWRDWRLIILSIVSSSKRTKFSSTSIGLPISQR